MQHDRWDYVAQDFDLSDEGAVDVVASLFGFKKQILAKQYYMIECLESYVGANDNSNSFFVPAGKAIQQYRARIKEVTRYT